MKNILFEMGSDIQNMYWSFVIYELKPQHRAKPQIANTDGSNGTEGNELDVSEFANLMEERE